MNLRKKKKKEKKDKKKKKKKKKKAWQTSRSSMGSEKCLSVKGEEQEEVTAARR